MKDYTKQIRGWKGAFWGLILLSLTLFIPPYFFKYELCYWDPCESLYRSKVLFMLSLSFIAISPIFFIKNKYRIWRRIILLTLFFTILNLSRPEVRDDFFMMGPYPTTLYIYILSIVVSFFSLYKKKL